MSDFEQRELSGNLFKNDRRETEAQPAYRGDAKIDGKVYKISAWVKDGKNGKFFSLAFTEKEEEPKQPSSFDNPVTDKVPF